MEMTKEKREITPAEGTGESADESSKAEDDDRGPEKSEYVQGAEILSKLPPEARKVVEVGMSMQRFGPMLNPLTEKINEKHIDKILEISAKDDERSFDDAAQSRKFTLLYVLIFVALFIFLTVFLVGTDKELYKEAIKLFAVFLGGFGGGFGIKSYMDRDQ